MSAVALHALALDDAQRRANAIRQLSHGGALHLEDAYATQHALVARRVGRGERVIGAKLGFTSRAKAQQMGVDDVIIGTLTDAMRLDDGGCLDLAVAIHPRVEPEVAYLLGADLAGGDADDRGADDGPVSDPFAVIAAVAPAIEVIDSRYRDFAFDLGDVVADNASSAAFAVGTWRDPREVGALDNRAVRLEVDGRVVQTGSTGAILGDPGRALAAALRLARAHGFALPAGSVLLAGAATAAVPFPRAGLVEAHVAGLGSVSIRAAREEGAR
ncbi:2-keto-4-pentenoate hydratase [Agromyces sp. LHK192]|uniref:2-keto-4-pentenoate hydratase n=1 Tax=Agromyces sp. LHK192 TaxID=2498704 RepID=UPI000FDCA46B|nr:fumarylacetoacetate hydrolase family protein [Agromyces sp. LHK192]